MIAVMYVPSCYHFPLTMSRQSSGLRSKHYWRSASSRLVVSSLLSDSTKRQAEPMYAHLFNILRPYLKSNVPAPQGAQSISRHLLSTYGENSFAFIMDEGGMQAHPPIFYNSLHSITTAGFGKHYGGIFAFPGIAEKGYFDVRVEVSSPGGHSSVPPSHTVSLPSDDFTLFIEFLSEYWYVVRPYSKVRGQSLEDVFGKSEPSFAPTSNAEVPKPYLDTRFSPPWNLSMSCRTCT